MCVANRDTPPTLNQKQHMLIISVVTEQIQDSLAFTMLFFSWHVLENMPRRLLGSCLYVRVLHLRADRVPPR